MIDGTFVVPTAICCGPEVILFRLYKRRKHDIALRSFVLTMRARRRFFERSLFPEFKPLRLGHELFASLSLLCLHHAQRLLPDGTQCSYATPAMYRSPVRFHPPSQAQDRSFGRTGNPCLCCAPLHFSSRNAFSCCQWEHCRHPLTRAGKLPLPYNTITFVSPLTLSLMAWMYELTAFLFLMPITNRSLRGVLDACTASHLSCIALFCAAAVDSREPDGRFRTRGFLGVVRWFVGRMLALPVL